MEAFMPVNLSIKSVPDALAERLRQRAARNRRSLQRELMTIVEAAVAEPASPPGVLVAAPAAPAYAVQPGTDDATAPVLPMRDIPAGDSLLAELDAVVAGSRWGHAPILTREQANDRRLQRELEYDSRQAPAGPGA
jgi:plasmid stability protein